jgi:hypothetical protein
LKVAKSAREGRKPGNFLPLPALVGIIKPHLFQRNAEKMGFFTGPTGLDAILSISGAIASTDGHCDCKDQDFGCASFWHRIVLVSGTVGNPGVFS